MRHLGAPELAAQAARSPAASTAAVTPPPAGPTTLISSSAPASTTAAAAPVSARLLPSGSLQIDDGFDRAWRRVGLSLDRSGFTIEDRDRVSGTYFVRYIDNTGSGPKPSFMERLTGAFKPDDAKGRLARYRLVLKGEGDARTQLVVQNQKGEPENSEATRQMLGVLIKDMN